MEDADLDPPLAPPQLTKEQALAVARNDHWDERLFSHPLSVEYGSHAFRLVRDVHTVGWIDVWMITIREVFLPRSGRMGGRASGSRLLPNTVLTIYVDDKAGEVVMATGSRP